MGASYAARGPFDVFQMMAGAAKHVVAAAEEFGHGHHRERGHGGRPGFGPWGWGGGGFPGGPPFGPPFGPPWGRGGPPWARGGRKAKRGDVRAAILALLSEEPRNGYQIIQEIAERSDGAWSPSPGAVYPALQQLADEGLIAGEESDGRKTFRLTDAGRAYIDEHADQVQAPWDAMRTEYDGDVGDLFKIAAQTGAAVVQVAHAGSEGQVAEARRILAETRRQLYGLLADDTEES